MSALAALVLVCGACGDDVSVMRDEATSESTGAVNACVVPEPRTELTVVACADAQCSSSSEDPWGPPHNGADTWSTTCTVAQSLDAGGSFVATLDSCSSVSNGWTPALVRVALDASLGGSVGFDAGRDVEVTYHSSRDELSWIWRGWFLRDADGRLMIARAKGRPPPPEVFEVYGLSVSLLDCSGVMDYCGSTLRYGALHLAVDGEEVTVSEGQSTTWQRDDGVWDVAVKYARSYEGAACGAYSDYLSVDFAIAMLADR